MKLKFLIAAVCCLFYITQSVAQKKQNVYFLKNSGSKVDKVDDADFIRVVSEPDSGSILYNVAEYYKNKTLKLSEKSSQVDPQVFEGLCVTYYPTGKKQEVVNYKGGNRDGDAYQYYRNGKIYLHKKCIPGKEALIIDCVDSTGKALVTDSNGYYLGFDQDFKHVTEEGIIKNGLKNGKWKGGFEETKLTFTEDYVDGNLIAGISVDENNVTNNYTKREIQPQFPGGLAAFGKFLGDNIRYPNTARQNGIQGRVVVKFVVERNGKTTDFVISSSPREDLSEEAIRVLKMSPTWVPGVQYGREVRVSYTVPVNFALQGPRIIVR
jgi:TonB family protein